MGFEGSEEAGEADEGEEEKPESEEGEGDHREKKQDAIEKSCHTIEFRLTSRAVKSHQYISETEISGVWHVRREFYLVSAVAFAFIGLVSFFWTPFAWSLLVVVPVFVVGMVDALQTRHAIRRNFPVIGN